MCVKYSIYDKYSFCLECIFHHNSYIDDVITHSYSTVHDNFVKNIQFMTNILL